MNITEKRARQLIEEVGLDWDNEVQDGAVYLSTLNRDYVNVSLFIKGVYLSVTFLNDNVEINHSNDCDILDTVLSFGWEGKLTYQEHTVAERTINMTSK